MQKGYIRTQSCRQQSRAGTAAACLACELAAMHQQTQRVRTTSSRLHQKQHMTPYIKTKGTRGTYEHNHAANSRAWGQQLTACTPCSKHQTQVEHARGCIKSRTRCNVMRLNAQRCTHAHKHTANRHSAPSLVNLPHRAPRSQLRQHSCQQ